MEPRTLGIDQIQSARGLQPVVSAASSMGCSNMDLGEEVELVTQEASLEAFRDIASAPF
ncbi:hypothetical protein TSUD_77880 [Trifolium subterraneum]|nr:hypothetical protein TSUD_77880 [Trifolium subterraneum]